MSDIAISNQQIDEPKYKNKGVATALLVSSVANSILSIPSSNVQKHMSKVLRLSHNDSVELSKATQEALKSTGLYDKGVRAYKVSTVSSLDSLKHAKNTDSNQINGLFSSLFGIKNIDPRVDLKARMALREELKDNFIYNALSKMFPKHIDKEQLIKLGVNFNLMQCKLGINAAYLPKANKIITPDKVLQTTVFHEIGHALNNNGSFLTKALQKCRLVAFLAPAAILLISLFNKKKVSDMNSENETSENKIQKTADKIKKHAPLLTALSMAPMVLEEGIASLRGQGVAKKLVQNGNLSKDIFKKIKLSHICSFSSYASAAVAAALACKAAICVKDEIQTKYEARKLEKENKNIEN